MNSQIDATDRRILRELTQNARLPFSQLAQKLKISNSLVHQRVKKLHENGIITDPVYQLNPEKLGYQTCAFTQIMISHPQYIEDIMKSLEQIPEIVECVNIAGRYAVMVKIYAFHNTHLRDIIYENIQILKGVEGTNTLVTFETNFTRSVAI